MRRIVANTQLKPGASSQQKAAKNTGKLATLAPLAKEINEHLAEERLHLGKAGDARLAAAVALVKAKVECERLKLDFKKWAGDNLSEKSWQTIRKLVTIGGKSNPAAALAETRKKNAEANARHRVSKGPRGNKSPEAVNKAAGARLKPLDTILAEFAKMERQDAIMLLKQIAETYGYQLAQVSIVPAVLNIDGPRATAH